MSGLKNDRYLRALLKQPVDRTPVWIMRQAGRYLPEYRATRQQAGDFLTLCKTPELACEVTLQPLERFELDAAILFSDILTIPDAMGLGLTLNEGEGPRFSSPIRDTAAINKLAVLDPEQELRYVMDAVRTIRAALDDRVPLIGFSGSPWTLATYMIEGRSSRDFARTKALMFTEPAAMHQLLDTLSDSVALYLNAQIAAGAQAVMIFDTWGGALSHRDYIEFSLNPMKRIIEQLDREAEGRTVPITVFTKGGGQWLEQIADCGCDAAGLDWTTNISSARSQIGDRVALQGNMDPALLHSTPERIRQQVATILADYGKGSGHIFNLGHGVTPPTNPDHVKVLIDAVHELSTRYHAGG